MTYYILVEMQLEQTHSSPMNMLTTRRDHLKTYAYKGAFY